MVFDIVIFRLAVVYLSDLDGTMIALNFWEGLHVGKLPLYICVSSNTHQLSAYAIGYGIPSVQCRDYRRISIACIHKRRQTMIH